MPYPQPSKWIPFVILLLFPLLLKSQYLVGKITDQSTGSSLVGATLQLLTTGSGTATDKRGFYRLKLPSTGTYRLKASFVGYQPDTIVVNAADSLTRLNLTLAPAMSDLLVEVTDRRTVVERRLEVSTDRLAAEELEALPVLLGEADVLRSLQFLPGVQSGVEGQSGFFVRGGSPDQNLVLLDGIPVYNPNHVFGFFSVFNVDAVQEVTLIKGGFPARYGGRLSSVVNVAMKSGREDENRRSVSLGPLVFKAKLSGVLNEGKTSYFFSGRRTVFDLLAAPFLKQSSDAAGSDTEESNRFNFNFGDLNLKLIHQLSPRDQLTITGYAGTDRYDRLLDQTLRNVKSTNDEKIAWSNQIGSFRHQHTWSDRLLQTTQVGYSRYNYRTGDFQAEEYPDGRSVYSLDYSAGVEDISLRTDLELLPSEVYTLRVGVGGNKRNFLTGTFSQIRESTLPDQEISVDTTSGRPAASGLETFAYLENIFAIGSGLSVNAGLHFSALDGRYPRLQPRLAIRKELGAKTAIRIGYAAMRQNLHLVVSGSIGLPKDLWVPANEQLRPQDSQQATIGLERKLSQGWSVEGEVYYKSLENVVNYKPGTGILTLGPWEDLLVTGQGEAYGTEWQLKRTTGRFNGWLAYTLSWSWRTFDELNRGERFPFRYDKRHNLRMVGNYELRPNRIFLNSSFSFTTGNPATITNNEITPGANAFDTFGSLPYQTFIEVNGYRIPPTHRLDLGVTFRKTTAKRSREISLGVYNLYGRRNPYYVTVRRVPDVRVRGELFKVSLFRVVPSFSYTIKW